VSLLSSWRRVAVGLWSGSPPAAVLVLCFCIRLAAESHRERSKRTKASLRGRIPSSLESRWLTPVHSSLLRLNLPDASRGMRLKDRMDVRKVAERLLLEVNKWISVLSRECRRNKIKVLVCLVCYQVGGLCFTLPTSKSKLTSLQDWSRRSLKAFLR